MERTFYIMLSEAENDITASAVGFKKNEGGRTELVPVSRTPEAGIAEKLEAMRLAKAAVLALNTWIDKHTEVNDVEEPRY